MTCSTSCSAATDIYLSLHRSFSGTWLGPFLSEEDKQKKAQRDQEKIDRIQQRAEAAQRYQKNGSWK
jgi:hypothetical protein